jgi:hypothetical protein
VAKPIHPNRFYMDNFFTFVKKTIMGTIHIYSNKPDDLYFLNELARRMNLKTKIEPPENETVNSLDRNDFKKADKKLTEMAFLASSAALEKFFEDETEKMF